MITLPIAKLRDNGIAVEDGQSLLRWIRWWRPVEIYADDARGYRHPWSVSVNWDGTQQRWESSLHRHSYVGGTSVREVEAPALPWDDLPRATRARYENKKPGSLVTPWLSEEPWFPIRDFRALGTGLDAETIPEPLIELGAGTPETLKVDREALTYTVSVRGSPVERSRIRLVRAVDVVLNVARARIRIDAPGDGSIGITLEPPARENPWVTVERARFEPPVEQSGTLEQFASAIEDPGIDRLLVARIYWLSPPGIVTAGYPDEKWTTYVKQSLFWNPQHRTNREINIVEPLNLSFPTGLAGGLGDGLIQATLADINLRDALASFLVSKASVKGVFYT